MKQLLFLLILTVLSSCSVSNFNGRLRKVRVQNNARSEVQVAPSVKGDSPEPREIYVGENIAESNPADSESSSEIDEVHSDNSPEVAEEKHQKIPLKIDLKRPFAVKTGAKSVAKSSAAAIGNRPWPIDTTFWVLTVALIVLWIVLGLQFWQVLVLFAGVILITGIVYSIYYIW